MTSTERKITFDFDVDDLVEGFNRLGVEGKSFVVKVAIEAEGKSVDWQKVALRFDPKADGWVQD